MRTEDPNLDEEEIIMNLWKETRSVVNHLDKMMDGVRVRVFTLFGTITTVAAALYYWAPNVFIQILTWKIRLSALVELTIIGVMIPSIIQNRLYHFWLFRSIRTLRCLEDLIYEKLERTKKVVKKEEILITTCLTEPRERSGSYRQAMVHSKLFWVEMAIFALLLAACVCLAYFLQLPLPK